MRFTLTLGSAQARFQKAFEQIMVESKRNAKTLFLQQVRGVIQNCIAVTPPMGGSKPSFKKIDPSLQVTRRYVDYAGPKRASKKRIEADVAKATKSKKTKAAQREFPDFNSVVKWYRKIQDKRKRPRAKQHPVPGKLRQQLKKHQINNQGWTASGWNEAISVAGIKSVPSWITKHSGQFGFAYIDTSRNTLTMEAVNGTHHPGSELINRRIAYGIVAQARSMERWLKNWNEKKAQQKLQSS